MIDLINQSYQLVERLGETIKQQLGAQKLEIQVYYDTEVFSSERNFVFLNLKELKNIKNNELNLDVELTAVVEDKTTHRQVLACVCEVLLNLKLHNQVLLKVIGNDVKLTNTYTQENNLYLTTINKNYHIYY